VRVVRGPRSCRRRGGALRRLHGRGHVAMVKSRWWTGVGPHPWAPASPAAGCWPASSPCRCSSPAALARTSQQGSTCRGAPSPPGSGPASRCDGVWPACRQRLRQGAPAVGSRLARPRQWHRALVAARPPSQHP